MKTLKSYTAPLTEHILLLTNPMLRAGSGEEPGEPGYTPAPVRRIPGSGL